MLSAGNPDRTYYTGTTQGALAVIRTFVPAGIHHILIGPDHILFLIGLLLLGGGWKALLKIVTAFTIGHSVTLLLAALNLVLIGGWILVLFAIGREHRRREQQQEATEQAA